MHGLWFIIDNSVSYILRGREQRSVPSSDLSVRMDRSFSQFKRREYEALIDGSLWWILLTDAALQIICFSHYRSFCGLLLSWSLVLI